MPPELHWIAVLANTCSSSAATLQYSLAVSVCAMSILQIRKTQNCKSLLRTEDLCLPRSLDAHEVGHLTFETVPAVFALPSCSLELTGDFAGQGHSEPLVHALSGSEQWSSG